MVLNVRVHMSAALSIIIAENGVARSAPAAHCGVRVYLLQFTVRLCLARFRLALMHMNSFLGCGEFPAILRLVDIQSVQIQTYVRSFRHSSRLQCISDVGPSFR